MIRLGALLMFSTLGAIAPPAAASDLQILTTGAYLPVALALTSQFEAETHQHIVMTNDTAGAVLARARAGASFDVIILTPSTIAQLAAAGIVQPASRIDVASVGIGVVVKAGAPLPDIATVDALRQTLIGARSIAYIDPASGGSSGIYVAQMLDRLGIATQIAPRAVLVKGGRVADHIADGEASLGIHQISEIIPVVGVTLVGPLPDALQNVTVYTAAISQTTAQPDAAKAFLAVLTGLAAAEVLAQKGMLAPYH